MRGLGPGDPIIALPGTPRFEYLPGDIQVHIYDQEQVKFYFREAFGSGSRRTTLGWQFYGKSTVKTARQIGIGATEADVPGHQLAICVVTAQGGVASCHAPFLPWKAVWC